MKKQWDNLEVFSLADVLKLRKDVTLVTEVS